MAKLFKKGFFGKKQQTNRDYLGGRPYDYCSNSLNDLTTEPGPMQPAGSLSSFHHGHGGGGFSSSSSSQYRNAPHTEGQGPDRYRHHSTEDDGAGVTDDFVFRGPGAITNGSRRISDGGAGGAEGYRRGDMAESRSPTSKKPIVMDDYSDPKDVLRAFKESGMEIPPEKPEIDQPYPPEDDYMYSVPYEAQQKMKQAEEQKKADKHKKGKKGSRHSDEAEWSVPKAQERFKHHTYEEPPDVSPPIRRPETPDSYVGESSDEINGHSPGSLSPSPHRSRHYSAKDHHNNSSSPMSSESADDMPPMYPSGGAQKQTPQHDRRQAAEYDNPWEWSDNAKRMAKFGQGEPMDSPRGRSRSELPATSRVHVRTSPESDTRPGDEYDQPWEWMPMSRKLSQAVTEKEKHHAGRVSPLPETPSKSNKKSMKLDIKSRPLELNAEPVDPNIPLVNQVWYHGKVSRSDAEKRLRSCREGSYLVRQSESAEKDFSLSLKSAKGFMHMKIVHHPEGFILGEFSKPYTTIPGMIFYYTQHKLNIRGAEHMALLHPVPDQLL